MWMILLEILGPMLESFIIWLLKIKRKTDLTPHAESKLASIMSPAQKLTAKCVELGIQPVAEEATNVVLFPQVSPLVRTPEGLRSYELDSITAVLNGWLSSKWLSNDDKLVLRGSYAYWQQAPVEQLQKLLSVIPPV